MATGSLAMPSKEPAPSFGTAEQAAPKGWSAVVAPAPAMSSSDGEAGAEAGADDASDEDAESLPLSEQAAKASGSSVAAAAVTARRR
nr:hypothetical protein StreXyl84_79300 [Streptomyces sp. Xyl84]